MSYFKLCNNPDFNVIFCHNRNLNDCFSLVRCGDFRKSLKIYLNAKIQLTKLFFESKHSDTNDYFRFRHKGLSNHKNQNIQN